MILVPPSNVTAITQIDKVIGLHSIILEKTEALDSLPAPLNPQLTFHNRR